MASALEAVDFEDARLAFDADLSAIFTSPSAGQNSLIRWTA